MMKNLHSILMLSALSILPAAASAQTVSDVDPSTVLDIQTAPDISSVTVSGIGVPRHHYPMSSDEFYKFKGSYDLANGDTLSLFNRNNVMYAKVGGQPWHRIVATAPNTFVAMDHMMKVRFEPRGNGDMGGELLLVSER